MFSTCYIMMQFCNFFKTVISCLFIKHYAKALLPTHPLIIIKPIWNLLLYQLHNLGLDLDFQLNRLLTKPIHETLLDHKQKIMDATKLRISEETWKPSNMVLPQVCLRLCLCLRNEALFDWSSLTHYLVSRYFINLVSAQSQLFLKFYFFRHLAVK